MTVSPRFRSPPTADERDRLRLFVRTAHEMRDTRYIQAITKNPQSMGAGFDENGDPFSKIPSYDWEDFRSFLTLFRKVAAAEDESIYLPKILNLVMHHSNDDVRSAWRDHTRRVNAIIDGRFAALQYFVDTPEGRQQFTGAKVLNVLINGLIFHNDMDKAADLSMLGQAEMGCHLFMLNFEMIMPVLNMCINLRNLIYWLQILPESDFPPPDRIEE